MTIGGFVKSNNAARLEAGAEVKSLRFPPVPIIFAAIGLVLGLVYAFYVPPLQVADEGGHFMRAYEVSTGRCIEPTLVMQPTDLLKLSAEFPSHLNEVDAVDDLTARIARAQRDPFRPSITTPGALIYSIYPCITYIPQAVGIGLARTLGLPPIDMLYAGRATNLLTYLVLVTLALMMFPAPFGPFVLLLAAMPMALTEAASVSQDAMVNAITILFVGYVAGLAWGPQAGSDGSGRFGGRETGTLLLLGALVGQCKVNLLLTPLVLLIPRNRWPVGLFGRIVFVGAASAASLMTFLIWHRLGGDISAELHTSTTANMRLAIHDPGLVLDRLLPTLKLNGWFYLESFVGRLGWLDVPLNSTVIVAYSIAMVLAVLCSPSPKALGSAGRLLCVFVVLLGAGAIMMAIWTMHPVSDIAYYTVGQGVIDGVQGRYLIPLSIPLAFAVSGLLTRILPLSRPLVPVVLATAMVLVGSIAAFAAIYDQFVYPQSLVGKIPYRLLHPARFYEGRFVHQESSDPKDNMILYVFHGNRYWIENGRWFRKHHIDLARELPTFPVLSPTIAKRIPLPSGGFEILDADTDFHPVAEAIRHDGELVSDPRGTVWLVAHGVRHQMIDTSFVQKGGYQKEPLAEHILRAIPIGDPIENFAYLNGHVVRAADAPDSYERDQVFLIDRGLKRWILRSDALEGRKVERLPFAVVDRIPDGSAVQ